MIHFKQSALINAQLEKVFNVVADPDQIPRWRTEVPAITQVSGPTKEGTTFLEEVNFMGKKQLLMKVKQFIPNQKIVIEAQSGMSLLPSQSFTFIREGNKTRIDLDVSMKVTGFFILMQFMLPSMLKKTWAKYFVNLDKLVSV